jgi:putative heme transporter
MMLGTRVDAVTRPPVRTAPPRYRTRIVRIRVPSERPHPLTFQRGLRTLSDYAWRIAVLGVAAYLVFEVALKFRLVVVALFGGLVIAAVLYPLVDLLAKVLPRSLAVTVSLLLGIAVVVGVFTFIVVSAADQASTLTNEFKNGLTDIQGRLTGPPFRLKPNSLTNGINSLESWISSHRGTLLNRALTGATTVVDVITGLFLAIFCSVFFMHGGGGMWRWFLGQLPATSRRPWDRAARAAWRTFAGYTHGTLIVAGTNAVMVCIALLILRVPLAFPLALLVFFASFVPLIGSPIALAVAAVVALAGRGPWIALTVVALIVLFGQIEGHVLQPLVMSRAVRLHPVVVALSVIGGSLVSGIVGAVMVVPFVSVSWSVIRTLREAPSDDPPDESPHDGARAESER